MQPLLGRAVLEQLLHEVVAERVDGERDDVGVHRVEGEIDVALVAQVELILQEAAAILVVSELQQPIEAGRLLDRPHLAPRAHQGLLVLPFAATIAAAMGCAASFEMAPSGACAWRSATCARSTRSPRWAGRGGRGSAERAPRDVWCARWLGGTP